VKSLRGWFVYAALIAVGAALAVASRGGGDTPFLPSVGNAGPTGTRALYLYLKEAGRPVLEGQAPFTELPPDVRTVVIPAPTTRELERAEVEALERFVEDGGTLVYLAPRPLGRGQASLESWLELEGGPALPAGADDAIGDVEDPGGTTARVWLPHGAMAGVTRLRVAADDGLGAMPGWAPVAGREGAVAVAWKPLGKGELWAIAGPELLENRRLELLDNLRFWDQLSAAGPMLFDEYHHQAVPPPPMSSGVLVFGLQLLACAALFAFARGSRFGPARPEPLERHRSSLEYLQSLAWLTRRARVEKELVAELGARLRVLLHERLGLSPSMPDAEVALALERGRLLPADRYLAAVAQLKHALEAPKLSTREYLRVSQELARIERLLSGRSEV
jgi:hypothetical protein